MEIVFKPALIFEILASIILFEQFWHNQKSEKNDYSLFWISMSFFVWIPLDLFKLDYDNLNEALGANFLSFLNNICLLLAYPYFQHAQTEITVSCTRLSLEGSSWKVIVYLFSFIFLLLTFFLYLTIDQEQRFKWSLFPPLLFSVGTILIILWVFIRSFSIRRRPLLKYLAILICCADLFVQIINFLPNSPGLAEHERALLDTLFPLIQSSYIFLYMQMSSTWIEEKKTRIELENLYLEFVGPQSKENLKDFYVVKMTLSKSFIKEDVILSLSEIKTLLMLANARYLYDDEGFISTDITPEMDRTRLCSAIALNLLAHIQNKDYKILRQETNPKNQEKNQTAIDERKKLSIEIRESLIEKRQGYRRLTIPKANIVYSREIYDSFMLLASDRIFRRQNIQLISDLQIIINYTNKDNDSPSLE